MTIDDLRAYVRQRLAENVDPNDIAVEIEEAVEEAVEETIGAWAKENGWSLWGTGEWRTDAACSICGSPYPGICGHEKDPKQVVLTGVEAVKRSSQQSQGPDQWESVNIRCKKCGAEGSVTYRSREDDQGHDDDEYHCSACDATWFVDGIDS